MVGRLEQGSIVWAEMLDPSGANAKLRPGVIITPTEAIVGDDPFVVVAVTSTFDEPIADWQVKLPWNRDKRKVGTKLNKPAVAHCKWLFRIRLSEIRDFAGIVPLPALKEILAKVAKYHFGMRADADSIVLPEMLDRLRRVLSAHQLACGALVTASGEIVARVGDFDAFGSAGLVAALLGNGGASKAMFDSLRGQRLPRIWAQGNEFALVDKPAEEIAVVAFGCDVDASRQYELSKAFGQSIAGLFSS